MIRGKMIVFQFYKLHTIFFELYRLSYAIVVLLTSLLLIIIGVLGGIIKRQIWRTICLFFLAVFVVIVFYCTLLNRSSLFQEIVLLPGNILIEAKENNEIIRTAVMNIILYIPIGAFLPYCFGEKKTINLLVVVFLSSFSLSLAVEIAQYVLMLGRSEIDDIICNTLGGLIGTLSYLITRLLFVLKRMRKNE